eukprot:3084568-Pyramimonas_sp.AAC.1
MTKTGKMALVWYVAVGSAVDHPTVRARSIGARSSGLQRPHPPDAGKPRTPPWKASGPGAPPRRERLRGRPPHGEAPCDEYPEDEIQRL